MIVTLHAVSPDWDHSLLHLSMAHATMSAHDLVSNLNRCDQLLRITIRNMQATATALLCEHEQPRDLGWAIAARDSAGTVSRRCWQPPATQSAACFVTASVCQIGFAQKLMTAICSVEWDVVINLMAYVTADTIVRPDAIPHDSLTHMTCRSEQHCIFALGVINVFVHARKHHRHSWDNPGQFEDCMQGRIRLMTAVAPACAHAFETLCFSGRPGDLLVNSFRLRAPEATYRSWTEESD